MVTAKYVFNQVRALLDDQEATFADDDYLRPFLQMALDDLVAECLRDPNLGEIKAVVVLPSVAAGTQSLGQELLPGGALALLSDPIEVREKRAGDQDINYSTLTPLLTPLAATATRSLNGYYTFTGSDLILPGANQDLDVWIWGSFKPAPITNSDTPLINDIEAILKYGCARLVARSRGNRDMATEFRADQMIQQSAWMRYLYKNMQSIRIVNRPWRPKTSFYFDAPSAS